MRLIRLTMVLGLTLGTASAGPLHVLRISPSTPADRYAPVVVTFDRPVAGGLEATVPAASIFRIEPAVEGRVRWRDPVSLVFEPAAPFEPGRSYAVTVAGDFRAMDGSRLEEPVVREFRVAATTVLASDPVGRRREPVNLDTRPVFSILVDAPDVAATLAGMTAIERAPACGGGRVPLRPIGERAMTESDPGTLRWAGWQLGQRPDGDPRRIVQLTPAMPLPLDCPARLLVPERLEPGAPVQAWPFRTHGKLRVMSVSCGPGWPSCPTGPARVDFSTPVRGAEVLRRVKLEPKMSFAIRDTAAESEVWYLDATLRPRREWTVRVDPALTDIFGQALTGPTADTLSTTGYAPAVGYDFGELLVEREGLRTLAVQHVNVDTLTVESVLVPDSLEGDLLRESRAWSALWQRLASRVERRSVPVASGEDVQRITGVVFPPADARADRGTVRLVRVTSPSQDSDDQQHAPLAVVQVSDLAVHARVGADQAQVWVTGVEDGRPRPGATVTVHDARGGVRGRAVTDADGIATVAPLASPDSACLSWQCRNYDGYVAAELDGDRAVVGINAYDPDLGPWRFGVMSAWGTLRQPAAAAVFTERGIYRPGEPLYAKAIVRDGPLGALRPPTGDSLRWLFRDRDRGTLDQAVVPLSEFGTADRRIELPTDLPLGRYIVEAQIFRGGGWQTFASTGYQVAEYRPPEFLVDLATDAPGAMGGDSIDAAISARYLFGAPMAGAPVEWHARRTPVFPWEIRIPGVEDWQVGVAPRWWDDDGGSGASLLTQQSDTLDATGHLALRVATPAAEDGMPYRLGLVATVTDANRQTATDGASLLVHPASFYIAARQAGAGWFWTAGKPVRIEALAVRPDGERISGVDIAAALVRREWHRVRRTRDGLTQEVAGWVEDTVATCRIRSAADPGSCRFTPPAGGSFTVALSAADEAGRRVATTFHRWAAGEGWVPWNDESQLKLDLVADRDRYDVGDTATVMIASPFTDVDAWVTVERERVLETRRIHVTGGASTLRIPIDERFAPNVFVSVLMVRGRSAPPGPLDDPGRPTMRVGYAELKVTPEVKRLRVAVAPEKPEYRPGDEARVRLSVRDADGRGRRAEVTLWAVDAGVLALTGYRTPDPVDLIYPPRGLGMRLASNLVAVAAQVPEGEKGRRAPGGGGGGDFASILRSRFQTTAFFLGSVVTDDHGNATATAKLPDNLTTFRVMAVAVTDGDRYGAGDAELLVSRPLLARPALPRFVRPGDRMQAGVVVNSRLPRATDVSVDVHAEGIAVTGDTARRDRVDPLHARDVRFGLEAGQGDSARFRFVVRGGGEADAVRTAIPVRPRAYPLVRTIAGVLRDTASAVFDLEDDIDPAASRLEVSFGSSPLAFVGGAATLIGVYPYDCSEQVSSGALPLIALYRARDRLGAAIPADAAARIRSAIAVLTRRQGADGGIGYWAPGDWSSPTLTAYAGRVLLEAREAGFDVPDSALVRVGDYLDASLRPQTTATARSAVAAYWNDPAYRRAEIMAAVDLLSRLGRPAIAAENSLLANAARLSWEDRVLLAQALVRRGDLGSARTLLAAALTGVHVDGRMLVLPDSVRPHSYFRAPNRPLARLLEALLMLRPDHPFVGPAVERLVVGGRVASGWWWSTYDLGQTVLALERYDDITHAAGATVVRIQAPAGAIEVGAGAGVGDTAVSLTDLIQAARIDSAGPGGGPPRALPLRLSSYGGRPVFYYLTVRGMPAAEHPQPLDRGITVERWYEDPATGEPIVSAAEGQVVRVRLRVTVPSDRTFVVLDDPLPAGLEAVDLSLRTVSPFGGGAPVEALTGEDGGGWAYGSWDSGMWSPFSHKEMRDDRVVYSATVLWPGSHVATYLARATTAGTFLYPPAHAEEMYNPGVNGRSGGGTFTVTRPESP